jgi:hypothetical protein
VKAGAAKRDFFGTAHGESDGKFDGFGLGDDSVQLTDTLLLIEPSAALAYEAKLAAQAADKAAELAQKATGAGATGHAAGQVPLPIVTPVTTGAPVVTGAPTPVQAKAKAYHGTADVNAAMAKMRLAQLAEEIVAVLVSDPNASVKVTLEISADFPNGAPEHVKRAVSENGKSLGLKASDWE